MAAPRRIPDDVYEEIEELIKDGIRPTVACNYIGVSFSAYDNWKNPGKARARTKKYREKHKTEIYATQRRYQKTHKEKLSEIGKRYRLKKKNK